VGWRAVFSGTWSLLAPFPHSRCGSALTPSLLVMPRSGAAAYAMLLLLAATPSLWRAEAARWQRSALSSGRHSGIAHHSSSHAIRSLLLRHKARECPVSCTFNAHAEAATDDAWMELFIKAANKQGLGFVSVPRKRATMQLARAAVESCVPGDIVETGLFTGGSSACIMRTLIEMDGCGRKFWGFDSWAGFPDPVSQDEVGLLLSGRKGEWKAPRAEFEYNLKALGAWDAARMRIVDGWFNDSIPLAMGNISAIALLRLDGDLYQSTRDVLELLYDKVTRGTGVVYVDDFGSFNGCRRAVEEFRAARGITAPMHAVVRAA